MRTAGIESAVAPIVDAFDALGVPYSIVGSVASSSHGVPRSTIDIDLVANLRLPQVESLVAALIDAYYIDGDAARDAVRHRSMFNVIHLDTMLKIDVYVLTERDFDQESFGRRSQAVLAEAENGRLYFLDTPEDTVVHKLEWYREGGEVAPRQWADAVGF
jgi:hypothetical protein